MTDKKQEAINRAARAKAILDDPLMIEAIEHIESECWRLFKQMAPEDIEGITQVKSMQYMHQKYQAFLRKVLDGGKLATLELEIERKMPRPKGY